MVKRVIKTILNVVLAVIIIATAAILVANFAGIKPYIVKSGSMEPTIMTGSVAWVNENFDYNQVQVDDIIAFKSATGAKVTHRAINITGEGIETKGDNNEMSDGVSTTEDNFCGKTIFWVPQLGRLMAKLNTLYGKIAAAAAIIALLLVDWLLTDDEEEKEDKKEDKKETEEANANFNQPGWGTVPGFPMMYPYQPYAGPKGALVENSPVAYPMRNVPAIRDIVLPQFSNFTYDSDGPDGSADTGAYDVTNHYHNLIQIFDCVFVDLHSDNVTVKHYETDGEHCTRYTVKDKSAELTVVVSGDEITYSLRVGDSDGTRNVSGTYWNDMMDVPPQIIYQHILADFRGLVAFIASGCPAESTIMDGSRDGFSKQSLDAIFARGLHA